MIREHEIEERLARIGQEWPIDDSFVSKVLERTAELPAPVPRSPLRRLVRASLAAAVGLSCGIAVWLALGPVQVGSSLYAQVLSATKKVESLHEVGEVIEPDGTATKALETWFARGRGFAVDLAALKRIDDGRFYWEHSQGARFAARSKSRGTDGLFDQSLDFKVEMDRFCERYPEGDRTIDGRKCQCYRHRIPQAMQVPDPQGRTVAMQTLIFVSEDSLVRRLESRRRVGEEWKLAHVRRWEYDVSVPNEVFRPAFGADVAIVDADEAFDRLVDVTSAVYVEERAGLMVAIHRAEKFEGGGLLLMASVRGTEETLKKFPLERRMMQPGWYVIDPPARNWRASPQGSDSFRIELASVCHQGIDVQWWIVIPRDKPADVFETAPGEFKVQLGVTPEGKYAAQHKDQNGVIQHLYWDATISIRTRPRSGPLPPLAKMAESVHADVAMLPSIKSRRLDLGTRDVNGVPTARFGETDTTSPREFADAAAEHVRYWQRGDVDFQIKQGGLLQFDPETRQQSVIPGAALSYNMVVDDETLKRFATERADVRLLWLRHTPITDAGLAHLKPLRMLEHLDLAETRVGDAGLANLHELKSLKHLDVTATQVTETGIRDIEAAIPGLKVVSGTMKP